MCFTSVSPYTANAPCQTGLTTTVTSSGTCINEGFIIISILYNCLFLSMNASDIHSSITILAFKNVNVTLQLYTYCRPKDWLERFTFYYVCVCVRWKMVDCYVSRVRGTMQLLQQQDIVGRTSELARVFGIQFFHVLTRGSQVRCNFISAVL